MERRGEERYHTGLVMGRSGQQRKLRLILVFTIKIKVREGDWTVVPPALVPLLEYYHGTHET